MAMNKKEVELFESALTAAALRATSKVAPDISPTDNGLTKGWAAIAMASDSARVEAACSSAINHGIGSQDTISSERPIWLYSTILLALKALRYGVEQDCARRLRKIDKMIEAEGANNE